MHIEQPPYNHPPQPPATTGPLRVCSRILRLLKRIFAFHSHSASERARVAAAAAAAAATATGATTASARGHIHQAGFPEHEHPVTKSSSHATAGSTTLTSSPIKDSRLSLSITHADEPVFTYHPYYSTSGIFDDIPQQLLQLLPGSSSVTELNQQYRKSLEVGPRVGSGALSVFSTDLNESSVALPALEAYASELANDMRHRSTSISSSATTTTASSSFTSRPQHQHQHPDTRVAELQQGLGSHAHNLTEIVDSFYDHCSKDRRVSRFFSTKSVDMARLRLMQVKFLQHVLGGAKYNSTALRASHKRLLDLNDDHFDAILENLGLAFLENGASKEYAARVILVAETTRSDILGR
ncbi:hypothetical protein GQ42DRAFT_165329 [Ramicandelaber brevisporus]|nr:hypothetical protein GQ42DRAFT_165329 [Ramicandelaber brevisporus]